MRQNERGLTLVEVMIAMAILGLVTAMFFSVVLRSSRDGTNAIRRATIEENGRRVLDEIANEVRKADKATILITSTGTPANNTVTFRVPTGFVSPNVTWSTNIVYQYEVSAKDMVQGVTNEGRVVRIQDGKKVVLCDYLKPGGLVVTRTGDNLVIRLTFVVNDELDHVLETSVETKVTLRNNSA